MFNDRKSERLVSPAELPESEHQDETPTILTELSRDLIEEYLSWGVPHHHHTFHVSNLQENLSRFCSWLATTTLRKKEIGLLITTYQQVTEKEKQDVQ
jgi:hypothetical protein